MPCIDDHRARTIGLQGAPILHPRQLDFFDEVSTQNDA